MRGQLLDNAWTRRIAGALERDHDRVLGIRRTMRWAQAFNRVKNRSYVAHRRRIYEGELDALFAENGPTEPAGPALVDGWSWDASRSLPHLE